LRNFKKLFYIIILIQLLGFTLFAVEDSPLVVVGELEMTLLSPPGRWYRARIDTGAELSSLNAFDLEVFDHDGSQWLRFNIASNLDSEDVILELPVERIVQVRQGNRPELQKRYIVNLDTVIGSLELRGEFTLADRRKMKYPVLIGRNLLSGYALVDVSRQYIHQ